MADAPASLRQADANIYKTAMRGEQLQSVKPIIAYWCDYWVLKQILAKGLHNSDPDILAYSSRLMDKMELVNQNYGGEEAITDDTAGQAYVEQFAQETLDRAQRVVKANKVTATTANTFDAAATFFGLVNVWGAPEAETLQKIKYAKWNAMRILKAVKDGTDPNASNPAPDELPPADESLLPGSDFPPSPQPAVPAAANVPRPVTIEDEPDDSSSHDLQPASYVPRRDSAGVSLPHSPASPASVVSSHIAPVGSNIAPSFDDPDRAHPLPSPSAPAVFPPSAPAFDPASPPIPPSSTYIPSVADLFNSQPPQPPYPPQQPSFPPTFAPSPHSTAAVAPPPSGGGYFAGAAPPAASGYPSQYNNRGIPQPSAPPPRPVAQPNNAPVDDVAIINAQKHAKWAISALNFEDVPTAVRELQKALQFLGAS